MKTSQEDRDRWDLIEDPTSSDVHRLIADVDDALALLERVRPHLHGTATLGAEVATFLKEPNDGD